MAQVSTTTPGQSINDPSEKVIRTRSTFPQLSYPFYNTHRFGEYVPFFVMEGVPGDKIPVRSSHEVRSYSMKAPLMQNIRRNKDFFEVPMEAILPLNWEKFYQNPTLGDDVSDNVGCGVYQFWREVGLCCNAILTWVRTYLSGTSPDYAKINILLRFLVFMEYFYSDGSLITSLGAHGSYKFNAKPLATATYLEPLYKNQNLDTFFDICISELVSKYTSFRANIDGRIVDVILQPDIQPNSALGYSYATISLHDYLEYLRDDMNCMVTQLPTGAPALSTTNILNLFDSTKVDISFAATTEPYNISRLWAYQLCVNHFYTNDHVDFIYSAELFRQLVNYCAVNAVSGSLTPMQPPTFTYNGVDFYYDAMSAKYLELIFGIIQTSPDLFMNQTTSSYPPMRGYFGLLFSYRRSLRFVDYFTGSRTRPLAVGNVDANVVSNKVNIIDVTQNIQRQRFLNAVNRFGRKFREYIDGLSGVTPAVDYHNPLYLGHTSDSIYGVETENTGVSQMTDANSITSRLQSNGARYQFDVSVDRPCIIIGISYYDIERVYITSTERQLLHMNRFDMFNPFMQFIGDQKVDVAELGSKRFLAGDWTFGYQLRHIEYKQRFPQAAGGFVRNLPGFIFTNKSDDERSDVQAVVSSDFIRSLPSELDPFFVSLTGWSIGTYFHFIVCDYNSCDASRPMAYAPSIL